MTYFISYSLLGHHAETLGASAYWFLLQQFQASLQILT